MNKENKKSESKKASKKVSKENTRGASNQSKASEKPASDFKETSSQKEKTHQGSKEKKDICLNTLFAYKVGMTHVYEKNQLIPVTALNYKTCTVTQIKKNEKEGYTGVQVALESSKKANKSMEGHFKKAGFKKRASFVREVRQDLPENIQIGQKVSIESLKQGDAVQVSGISKGHGFSGVVKRWGFGGGPASHGAEKHRTTGSIANTATQGRVFPGKKLPGHFGCDRITISNLTVVQIHPQEGFILIKGSVPGAKGSLVEVRKQEARS